MVSTLVERNGELALIMDRSILDLLKIDATTELEIYTEDGKSLHIRPANRVQKALEHINKEFKQHFGRLAKYETHYT
jgi:hypothetical protein